MNTTNTFHSIEDIQTKKEELKKKLHTRSDVISSLWQDLTTVKKTDDKGELVVGMVSKGIMAFDAFLTISKLYRRYGGLFKRKKRR